MFASIARSIRTRLAPVTALGWTLAGFALISWVLAAAWDWDELFMMAGVALVLCAFGVLYLFGRLSLAATIEVSPSRLVAGERAAGQLVLSNERSRSAFGLTVEMPVGNAVASFELARLAGRSRADELFVVPTNRRAVIPCGPVTSVQGDPLGMVRRAQTWTDEMDIYVHPKTVPLPTLVTGLVRDLEGHATTALSSSDIAFHTLREYHRGDDLRHVHWKSSAKIGDLMVRQYNDTRRSHIAILLSIDPDDYTDEDELELSISCAASVALQALRDGQATTVVAGDQVIPAVTPTEMLDRFSAIDPMAGTGGLTTALQSVPRLAPDASLSVIGVGASVPVPMVRRTIGRVDLGMPSVVLYANQLSDPAYFSAGDVTFVSVPHLDRLAASVGAVLG